MHALVLALAAALGPVDLAEDRLPLSLADVYLEPAPKAKADLEWWVGGHLGVAGAYDGDSPCFVIGFEGRLQILPWLAADATLDFQTRQEFEDAPGAHFFQVPFMFSGVFYPPLELGNLRPYGIVGFGFTITDVSGPAVKDDTSVNLLFFLGFGAEFELAENIALDANVRFVFAQDPPHSGSFSADWAQFTVGILFKLGK
jgi:opacity protein-like surface antigen